MSATEIKSKSVLSDQYKVQNQPTGLLSRRYAHRLMVLLFLALFFFVRLYNLTLAGMYYDEPLYIYWGQVIGSDWNQRFMGAIYLSRQPLHAWFLALFERIISDPVLAGRLVSVIAGTFTMAAVWLLANRLFSKKAAIIAVLLYTLTPYTLHFDRTALTDSLLCAEDMWMLYLSIRLLDRLDSTSTIGLSVSFAMALLTKSYGRVFPLLLPLALFSKNRNELTLKLLTNWATRLLLGLGSGFLIYYLVFGMTPYAAFVDGADVGPLGFIMSPSMLATFPWDKWEGNLSQVIQWFSELATIPLSLVGVIAILVSPRFGARAVSVSLLVVPPIIGSILLANVFYERYILFTIPPFLILVAFFLERTYTFLASRSLIANKHFLAWPLASVLGVIGFLLLLFPSIASDFSVLTDFGIANRFTFGYYGLNEASDYLADQAKDHLVYVIANDESRPAGDGTAVLLRGTPNIKFFRVKPDFGGTGLLVISDPSTGTVIPKDYFISQDVYYVFEVGVQEDNWLEGSTDLVQSFPNLKGDDSSIGLYRIRFDNTFK